MPSLQSPQHLARGTPLQGVEPVLEPSSTGTAWCSRCTKRPQGGEGVGKCQRQALPQPVLPRQPNPSTAARDTVPA